MSKAGLRSNRQVKPELVSTQERLPLDADTFQNLLAAAFVLQEEASRNRPQPRRRDQSQTLSEIVETQSLIQSRQLDLAAAVALITERVQRITRADGAAIGMVEGEEIVYRAGVGNAAGEVGLRVPIDDSLSAQCVRTRQGVQSADAERDPRLSVRLCRERGVKSLIALPIYHEGKVTGVIELWFSHADSFRDHDVRSCQLMAGLITEAIARYAEMEWKQALAVERATMLEALEKLKPQLERLTIQSALAQVESLPEVQAKAADSAENATVPEGPVTTACRGCGHELGPEESYCGLCGTPRSPERPAGERLQAKWASMWRMEQATEDGASEPISASFGETTAAEETAELPDVDFASLDFSNSESGALTVAPPVPEPESAEEAIVPSPPPAEATGGVVSPWSSAVNARIWLEQLKVRAPSRTWLAKVWRSQRANIYLGIAAALLLTVIWQWVAHPAPMDGPANPAAAANMRHRKPPAPQLTFFEKVLVGLGIAEPPPASIYLGNPRSQVWVDVHTALYYCTGDDLFGKTPGGRFSTQQDAQQDQFEPAHRKACD